MSWYSPTTSHNLLQCPYWCLCLIHTGIFLQLVTLTPSSKYGRGPPDKLRHSENWYIRPRLSQFPWYQGSAVSPASAQRPHVKYLGRGRFTSKSKFMRFMSSPMFFCVNKISPKSIPTKNPPNKTNVKSTTPPKHVGGDFNQFEKMLLNWIISPGRGENSKNIWSFTT